MVHFRPLYRQLCFLAIAWLALSSYAYSDLASWQAEVTAGTPAATRFTSVSGASPVSINVGSFSPGTARSFEFIFNAAGAGPSKTLLGSIDGASGSQFLKLHQWQNTAKFGVSTAGVADDVFANSPTRSNQQVHAVFVSSGNVTTLYLDGVAQTGTINRALAITGTNGLGAISNATHTSYSDNLDGSILGFASYGRALNQTEITARYNALLFTPTAPGAPTIGAATILGDTATVAFTPPASDGGSAITGYTATSSPGGLTGTGTSSPISVSGLVAGTSYSFTVTATNVVGTGPASAASNAVMNNNFPPTDVVLSNNAIQEGNSANATIGALSAVDMSVTDAHTFTLVSGAGSTDNGSFSISGNTLQITPVASAAAKSSYALRIRATDQLGSFVEKRFTVWITAAVGIPEQLAGWRQRVQATGPTATHLTSVTDQNPVTLDVGNFADGSARSFEFVFHARGFGISRSLLTPVVSAAQVQSLRFNQFNNTQKFGVTTSGVADDVFANSPTRANELVHAVFVSNGSLTSLYLNGVLQTATIARGLSIKGSNRLGFDLDGMIYGFASYNKALTQGEISSHAQGIVGLGESVPVQDFNLATWQTVVSQNNATRTRFTPVVGTNPQTIDVGTFAPGSARSFEFVAEYANMNANFGELLAKGTYGDDANQYLVVFFEPGGQRMMLTRMAGTNSSPGSSFATQSSNLVKAANQKVHLVFVSSGSWTTDWYLNGIKQQTIQLPLAITGSYGLGGSSPTSPLAIPGTIHGFASYGRVLTQAEVNARFQALAAPAAPPTIFTAWENLVSADQPAALRLEPVFGSSPVSMSVGTFATGAPRTFEFIFNAAGAGPSKTLLGSLSAASGGQSLQLNQWNNTGKFGLTTSGVADEVFSHSPTLSNQSVHAVFVSNGSVTTLYLNGVLQTGSISRAMRITGTNGLGAAGNAAHNGFFDNLDGSIQRFASYGRALTQAEVTQRHQALNSPVNSGQNTVSNITAWRKQVSAARPAAKYFPTVSGASPIRLDVGNFAAGSPRSFEFICQATGAGPSKALLGSLDSFSGGQILQFNQHNDTQKFGVSTSGVADEFFSSSVTTSNRKVHVVYTSDGTATRLYVNGILQMRPILRGLSITGINGLGAYDNATHDSFLGNLDGTIEGFASYGRELTPAEITARFQTLQDNITVPGAPLIGSALEQDAAAIVSFGAPVNNGGEEITGYTVTSSPGGITATGTGSPITVAGLTNGVSYTFTVTATNSIGAGANSAASNAVVPAGEVNTAPTDVHLLSTTIPDENSANATVSTLSATDANPEDTHTFTLVSGAGSTDNASFTISGNTLRITPVTNAATKSNYALRVRATDAGGLFFEKAFTVRVVVTGANVAKFATSQLHVQPSFNYKQTVTGNFDGDGIPDIAALTTNDQCIVLLSSQGFATAHTYNSSRASTAITLADVNRDGVLDLVLGWGAYTNPLTAGVVAYFGSEGAIFDNSPIELISLPNPPVAAFPAFVTAMGVDGNQWPKIMVQSPLQFGIRFYQKNGTPWGYDLLQSTDTDSTPDLRGAVAGDFNQDGVLDLAIATLQANGSSKVSFFMWNIRTDIFTISAEIKSIAAGDLDGDGKLDLAIAAGNGANGQLILARNTSANVGSSLTFDTPTTLTTGTAGLLGVRCADINRDGRQDVITSENQQLRVFYGSGNMTLTASVNNPISVPTSNNGAGGISMNFAAGDFSGDGMIDLFAGNGQLLTNLRGALFAPKPLNLVAGFGQTARPSVPLWIGSSPTPLGLNATSVTPWLSVTSTNGFPSISSVMASVDSASRPLGKHRGKVNLSSGNLQGTEANVILDVIGAVGALGASQIVPLPDESIRRSSVASGDFNNDGRLDFVNARTESSNSTFGLRVMLTGSNGALSSVISSYSIMHIGNVTDPTPGDYNGDGHLDVVVFDAFRAQLVFFPGNGTGVFGMPVYTGASINSVPTLQKADFNGDGIDDILMLYTDRGAIQLGTNSGIFTAAGHMSFAYNGELPRYTVGDFNGDGSLDIFNNNKISLGDGLGGIGKRLAGTNLTRPDGRFYNVRADDFNGDNISDVIYWHQSDLWVSFGSATLALLPDGQQSYLSTPTLIYNASAAGYSLTSATTGDINGDGILDIVTIAGQSDLCITLLGNGDGTFQTARQSPRPSNNGGDTGWPVLIGDVSGDGAPDVFQIRGHLFDPTAWHFYRLPGQAIAATSTTLATTSGGTGLFGGVAPVSVTVAATNPTAAFAIPLGSVSLKKGSTIVATSTRSTAGVWTFSPVGLGVGSHTLTAQYDGDLRNAPSVSGSVTINIVKAVAEITLASSLGVSQIGDTVTFSANISPVTSGSISFFNDATLLGTGTIDASGLATFTTSSLPTGSNSISASFAGNSDVNASISSPLTQVVNKVPATVTLKNLLASFDGTAKSAGADTLPAGLPVTFTYNGTATPPSAVGSYTVVATVNDSTYQGSVTGTFIIQKGTAVISIANVNRIFDGSPKPVAVTTTPAGLPFTISYNGSGTAPSAIGSYPVVVTIDSPNYQGTANDTLVISAAAVTTTTLASSANPSPFLTPPTFTATVSSASGTPSGEMQLLIDNVLFESKPVNASGVATFSPPASLLAGGSRSIRANYNANGAVEAYAPSNATITQVVDKADLAVTLDAATLSQTFNGSARVVTASITPPATHNNVQIDITYDGSSIAPINAGTYAVLAIINDPSLQGSASGTLIVSKAAVALESGPLTVGYTGQPISPTLRLTPDVPFTVTYDATANGTPAGNPTASPPINAGNYHILVAVSSNYELTPPHLPLFITKRGVGISLSNLSVITDGTTPSPVIAVTNPPGMNLDIQYTNAAGGSPSSTPPSTAGLWNVSASVSSPNHEGSATAQLRLRSPQNTRVVLNGPTTEQAGRSLRYNALLVNAVNLPAPSTSPAPFPEGTPAPSGIITFKQSGTVIGSAQLNVNGEVSFVTGFPARLAPYNITAEYGGSEDFFPTTNSNTIQTTVTKIPITPIADSPLVVTYDGLPKEVKFTTALGKARTFKINVTYAGAASLPINASANLIPVVATIDDPDYQGTTTVQLRINPAPATITVGNTFATFDDSPKPISVITNPPNLPVTINYSGFSLVPSAVGTHPFAVQLNNANYIAPVFNGTLSISAATSKINIADLTHDYDGNRKQVKVAVDPPAPFTVTYNGSAQVPNQAGIYDVNVELFGGDRVGRATAKMTINGSISARVKDQGGVPVTINDQYAYDPLSLVPGSHVMKVNEITSGSTRLVFEKWADGSTDNPRTISVGNGAGQFSSYRFMAVMKEQRNIMPEVDGLGTITGAGFYDDNELYTARVTSEPGYVLSHWRNSSSDLTDPQYFSLKLRAKAGVSERVGVINRPVAVIVKGTAVTMKSSNHEWGSVRGIQPRLSDQFPASEWLGDYMGVKEGRSFRVRAEARSGYTFSHWSVTGANAEGAFFSKGGMPFITGIEREFTPTASECTVVANFVKNEPRFDIALTDEGDDSQDLELVFIPISVGITENRYFKVNVKNVGNANANTVQIMGVRVTAMAFKPSAGLPGGFEVDAGGFHTHYFESTHPSEVISPNNNDTGQYFLSKRPLNRDTSPTNIGTMFPGSPYTRTYDFDWPSFSVNFSFFDIASVNMKSLKYRVTAFVRSDETGDITPVSIWVR